MSEDSGNQHDPLELFANTNPIPDETTLPATADYLPAQELLARLLNDDEIADEAPRQDERRRRRRRIVIVTIVAAVGVGGASAAAVIASRRASDPLAVACYAGPSLSAEISDATVEQDVGPVAACTRVWETGAFSGPGGVPRLVGCVLETGIAGVFPSEDPNLCAGLGLSPLDGSSTGDDQLVGLQATLSNEFTGRRCVLPHEARRLVQAELDRRRLIEWRIIDPGPYSAEQPCATLAFDASARTVTFVPLPPPPSPPSFIPTTTNEPGGI